MESLEVLNAKDIPFLVQREFTVECCVRGHHVYQKEWEAEIGSKLTAQYETRPGALVQDTYAIALKQKDVVVGHIPKFLSKITYFYLKHGGDVLVEIIGKRQYSRYQYSRRNGTPSSLRFQDYKPGNAFTVTQSCQKGHENIQRCKDKSNGQAKKRQNKRMICIFEHYSYTKKKI